MIIGIPKESLNNEYRVALTPDYIPALIEDGHQVFIQHDAGLACGFTDQDYKRVGASLCSSAEALFQRAQMIVKVKEPQANELHLIRKQHRLFCYLHLAAHPQLTEQLLAIGCTALAYETYSDQHQLPILEPMSDIAGRIAVLSGCYQLQAHMGGKGLLLQGATGVPRAKVLIIGAGIVGSAACQTAIGLGAHVTVFDIHQQKLKVLEQQYGSKVNTQFNHPQALAPFLGDADLIIGAVLIPGAKAPKVLTEQQLTHIQNNAVIVDVAIDQGGCFASSQPTTFQQPTFTEQGVIHYCVSNLPSAAALTASMALSNSSINAIRDLAKMSDEEILAKGFHNALNIHDGDIYHEKVAEAYKASTRTALN